MLAAELARSGVDTENVGRPRNNDTRGNGRYAVPIKLGRTPSATLGAAPPRGLESPARVHDHAPAGIARVSGDRIILDGTTIEEVRDVHARTLRLVVEEVNSRAGGYDAAARCSTARGRAASRVTRRTCAVWPTTSASTDGPELDAGDLIAIYAP